MKPGITKCIVTGLLTGVVNGLFGAGGGMVLLPLLTGWLHLPTRRAMATSVAIILPICFISFIGYFVGGSIDVAAAWPYVIGGSIGGLLSGKLFHKASAVWLRRGFGALILYSGIRAVLLL